METPSSRLRDARLAAGFATASEACATFGWEYEAYKKHEQGAHGRTVPQKAAKRYADAFGVPAAWILYGENRPTSLKRQALVERPRSPFRVVPKISPVEALMMPMEYSALARAALVTGVIGSTSDLGPRVFMIDAHDDSMEAPASASRVLSISRGDEVAFDPDQPCSSGDVVLAEVQGYHGAIIRKFRPYGPPDTAETYDLVPINPDFATESIGANLKSARIIARAVRLTTKL